MFERIFSWLQNAASHLFAVLGEAAEQTVQNAVPAFDALLQKYLPLAIEQVKAAATNTDLLQGSEKRGAVINNLKQQLEIDGHNVEADGFEAFTRLLTETAVNTLKMATGTELKAPPAT